MDDTGDRRVEERRVTASARRRATQRRVGSESSNIRNTGLGSTSVVDQPMGSFFPPAAHFPIATTGLAAGVAALPGSFDRFAYRDRERSTESDDSGFNREYIPVPVPHSVLLNMMHGGTFTGDSATRIPTVSDHQIGEGGRDDVYEIGGDHGHGSGGDADGQYGGDGENDGGGEDDGSDEGGTRGNDGDDSDDDGDDSDDDDDESDDNESMDEIDEDEGGDDGREDMEDAQRNTTASRRRMSDDWMLKGPAPGGPIVPDLLRGFKSHVAFGLWDGEDPGVRRLHNRGCTWPFASLPERVQDLIRPTGLHILPQLLFDFVDHTLVSAFVERWHPETNSFHMPFGEITITLHDVFYILALRPDGYPVCLADDRTGYRSLMHGTRRTYGNDPPTVAFAEIQSLAEDMPKHRTASLWLTYTVGLVLFMNKSGDRCYSSLYPLVQDPASAGYYSWGSAVLAWTYRQLGIASRADTRQISGCGTLIQVWLCIF